MKPIIAINGRAGAGKDTIADFLVRDYAFAKIALADPLKRICRDVFGFTDEQLWGPSEKRNEEDKRFPREFAGTRKEPRGYLSPRYALQTLGTEWGRDCYPDVWIDYAMRMANAVLEGQAYTPARGLVPDSLTNFRGVVISDARFRNEFERIRQEGGILIRVERPGAGLEGAAAEHRSETESREFPDDFFDVVMHNGGTLEDLRAHVRAMVESHSWHT